MVLKNVVIDVPGYLFVSRSVCTISPSKTSDTKMFEITLISDDGFINCGKNSIIGVFNYNKDLGLAIAKSFPSGTFPWEIMKFEGQKQNEHGYVIFD